MPSATFYLQARSAPGINALFLNLWRKMDWARCYFIHPVVIEYVFPRTIVSTSCTQWFSTVSFPTNYGNPKFLSKKGVCSWDSINANLLSLCLLWLFFSELDSNLCSHSMQLFVWKPISFFLKRKLFVLESQMIYGTVTNSSLKFQYLLFWTLGRTQ